MTQPLTPEREAHIQASANSSHDVSAVHIAELLAEIDRLREALASEQEDVAYLHRNTIADLRRAAQGHLDGKARWRERAEKAEAELTVVEESATRTRLADMDAPQPTPGRDARYELYAALTYPQWNPATNSHSTGEEKAEHLIAAHRAQVLAEAKAATATLSAREQCRCGHSGRWHFPDCRKPDMACDCLMLTIDAEATS